MASEVIRVNRYWFAQKHGPRNFTAYRPKRDGSLGSMPCDAETRFYFSREALERDFGSLAFPGEIVAEQEG